MKTQKRFNIHNIFKYSFIPVNLIFILLFLLFYLDKLPAFWINKNTYVFYGFLIFNTIFLALKINKIPENEKEVHSINFWAKYLFLLILIVLAINQFLKRGIINQLNPYLISSAIATGFLTFYSSRERVEREIEDEKTKEEQAEKKRYEEFDKKFKRISKLNLSYGFKSAWHERRYYLLPLLVLLCPFVFIVRLPYKLIKWGYREGWGYVLWLIIIIIIFVVIKYPYIHLDFTGLHDMKYSTYVEPAKHMLEHGPLWNEMRYSTDPITFPNGVYDTFGSYPIIEWGLYSTFILFPGNSLEFNTRLFMTFIGILILVFAYLFFKRFINKKQTLLILLLLGINYIFQFFTYVTVLDPINILFMFISLIFLVNGLEKNNIKSLFISGIIAGIGINIKYHALIFYFPIFFILIYFYKKLDEPTKLSYLFLIFPNFLLQTIFFRISIRYLPRNPILFGSVFIFLILIHIILYLYIEKIYNIIRKIINFIGIKTTYFLIIITSIILFYFLINIWWIKILFNDFITDRYLIFNWKMYKTLLEKYKLWLSIPMYIISIINFFLLLLIKNKKLKLIMYTFFISSLFYFILTSKVLYFHDYYQHIIIFTIILFFSNYYIFLRSLNNKILLLISIIAILIIIIPLNINIIDKNLSIQRKNITYIGDYLNKHMSEDEFFIINIPASVSFYSDRKSFFELYSFPYNKNLTEVLRNDLEYDSNLSNIMKKYKIRYYVISGPTDFRKNNLIYLFYKDFDASINDYSQRTIIILCKENQKCIEKESLLEVYKNVFEKNINSYLILEKQIGDYYIYRFY